MNKALYNIETKTDIEEVVDIFEFILTNLLKTRTRTLRRVIFSKNSEEFKEIIKDSLEKKLKEDKNTNFLKNVSRARDLLLNNRTKTKYCLIQKIINILRKINDEKKLKRIYQVIKIIIEMEINEEVATSLVSSEESQILSEKTSSINEIYSSIKELDSVNTDRNDLSNKIKGNKGKKICKSLKKKKLQRSKIYEMSDKNSLFSLDEVNSNNSWENIQLNRKKYNSQIQNKFNFDMISSKNLNNSFSDKDNNTSNNIHFQNIKNYNTFSPGIPHNLMNLQNSNNSHNSLNSPIILKPYNSQNETQKCPKIIIDYGVSSNSDIDRLLVTSEMDKRKLFKKDNYGQVNNSYEQLEFNVNKTPLVTTNFNIYNNNYNNPSSSDCNIKNKQIFFPCEISDNKRNDFESQSFNPTKTGYKYNHSPIMETYGTQMFNPFNNISNPFFSMSNTPKTINSNNAFLDDCFYSTNCFKQPNAHSKK